MIKQTILILSMATFLLGTNTLFAEDGVNWGKNIDSALKHAKKNGQNVLIAVGATYCKSCKKNKKKIKSDVKVTNIIRKDFQSVYITADDDGLNYTYEGEKLNGYDAMNKVKVSSYPTYLIMNSKGKVLRKISGRLKMDDFAEFLNG